MVAKAAGNNGAKGSAGVKKDCATKRTAADNACSAHVAKNAKKCLDIAEETGLQWIMDFLRSPPKQILYCKSSCENGMFDKDARTNDLEQEEVFHSTYTMFKSLPKYFMAGFMVQHCNHSKEWVDLIDSAQPGQLRMVFTNWTGVSDYSWWPPALHRHELLVTFLKNQLLHLGNRHQDFPGMWMDRALSIGRGPCHTR